MSNIRIPTDYKENVSRAFHNLSRVKRLTMHPGLKYPFYVRRVFLGDDFKLSIPQKLLQSMPTVSPIMGSYKLRVEWYYQSDSNLYGFIDNNDKRSTEDWLAMSKHTMNWRKDIDSSLEGYPTIEMGSDDFVNLLGRIQETYYTVPKGGLLDFIGIAPGAVSTNNSAEADLGDAEPSFISKICADSILMYLNIARSYWINPQWPDIPYVSRAYYNYGNNSDNFETFNLTDLDNFFKLLRTFDDGLEIQLNYAISNYEQVPNDIAFKTEYKKAYYSVLKYMRNLFNGSSAGLFCCQYEPDLYRNLLSDEVGTIKSRVDTSTGTMTIEELRFANHLQLVIDRLDISGGRFSDWARTRWGVKTKRDLDIPQLLGVTTEYIDTTLVTSRENSTDDEGGHSSPGQMHGNINQKLTTKPGFVRVKVTNPGYIMAVVSVVPEVDYCQNIERYLLDTRFEDEFSPQYAKRGFESVPLSDYNVLPSFGYDPTLQAYTPVASFGGTNYKSLDNTIGKQVAYLREMTDTNRVHGEFSNGGFFETWVLKRRYFVPENLVLNFDGTFISFPTGYFNFSPYVNPLEWQYPFVAQNITDPNFYFQVAVKCDAIRPIGRRYMPSLE